jgi:putative zinc finger/helix-turn-helix YgiT family protein
MTDEDDVAPDRDDDEELPFWERHAESKIRGILDSIEYNVDEGTVTAWSDDWDPRGKGDATSRTFSSLEEFRQELVELGDSELTSYVPWENGPLFSTDSDDIVDNALHEAGVERVFDSLEVPADSDLLLDADDLTEPDQAHEIRLTIEEVNDLLIKYLATHPEVMREVHPRRFEELVAELFRRMGYDVMLTPRSKDGGFDILAFHKKSVGKLLTLVECKRYSPDHKIGVGLVRSLYGVIEEKRATHGVIATTSSFTRGARAFQQNLEYRLSLRDFNDLATWCKEYQKRQHCAACDETIIPHELDQAIDRERYRRLGLLVPEEIRRVREKTGLSAVHMSHLLSVGEKTYTRWENGRSLQTKASDTLIRLIDENPEMFATLAAEREPGREAFIDNYFNELEGLKGNNHLAMAAHGGDMSTEAWRAVRKCLTTLRRSKKR